MTATETAPSVQVFNTSSPTSFLPSPSPSETPKPSPTFDCSTLIDSGLEQTKSYFFRGINWYILIMDDEEEILIQNNPTENFPPASMIKIPTVMAVLKILENEGKTLSDIQSYGIAGRNFSDLIEATIVHSEEQATEALEFYARGDNRLRKILDSWGMTETRFDPRRSTAKELMNALIYLDRGKVLGEEYRAFLLDLMGQYTKNDDILLGKLLVNIPDCQFLNKRGTLLNPTIVSDMGILRCGEQSWYLVVAGTPAAGSTRTFEEIQASIEAFALAFGEYIQQQGE